MIMTTFVQVSLDLKYLQLVSSLVEKDVKVEDNRNSAVIVIIGYFFLLKSGQRKYLKKKIKQVLFD